MTLGDHWIMFNHLGGIQLMEVCGSNHAACGKLPHDLILLCNWSTRQLSDARWIRAQTLNVLWSDWCWIHSMVMIAASSAESSIVWVVHTMSQIAAITPGPGMPMLWKVSYGLSSLDGETIVPYPGSVPSSGWIGENPSQENFHINMNVFIGMTYPEQSDNFTQLFVFPEAIFPCLRLILHFHLNSHHKYILSFSLACAVPSACPYSLKMHTDRVANWYLTIKRSS